jgi:hypothetical protein
VTCQRIRYLWHKNASNWCPSDRVGTLLVAFVADFSGKVGDLPMSICLVGQKCRNRCRPPCFIMRTYVLCAATILDMISSRDDVLAPRNRNVRRDTLSWSSWRSEHSCLTPQVSPRPRPRARVVREELESPLDRAARARELATWLEDEYHALSGGHQRKLELDNRGMFPGTLAS